MLSNKFLFYCFDINRWNKKSFLLQKLDGKESCCDYFYNIIRNLHIYGIFYFKHIYSKVTIHENTFSAIIIMFNDSRVNYY